MYLENYVLPPFNTNIHFFICAQNLKLCYCVTIQIIDRAYFFACFNFILKLADFKHIFKASNYITIFIALENKINVRNRIRQQNAKERTTKSKIQGFLANFENKMNIRKFQEHKKLRCV